MLNLKVFSKQNNQYKHIDVFNLMRVWCKKKLYTLGYTLKKIKRVNTIVFTPSITQRIKPIER